MVTSTVAVVIAANAAATSSAAATAARQARRTACEGFISTYDAKTATVEQAQNYASCIETLYPKYSNEPMTRGEAWAIKGIVIFVLVCVALGVWWVKKDSPWTGWVERILFGTLTGLFGALLVGAFCGAGFLVWKVAML